MKKLTKEQIKLQSQEARLQLQKIKDERIEFCKKHKLSNAIEILCSPKNNKAWRDDSFDCDSANDVEDEETAMCVSLPLRGNRTLRLITKFRQGTGCLIGKHFHAFVLDKEIDYHDGVYHLNLSNQVFFQKEETNGPHVRNAVIKSFRPGKWVDVLLKQAELEKSRQEMEHEKAVISAVKKELKKWEPVKTRKRKESHETV